MSLTQPVAIPALNYAFEPGGLRAVGRALTYPARPLPRRGLSFRNYRLHTETAPNWRFSPSSRRCNSTRVQA
jgi:hypothetical protein